MPLPSPNPAGNFADSARAERLYRDALIGNAKNGGDHVDFLAKGLVAAIAQKNRKPLLCRLFG